MCTFAGKRILVVEDEGLIAMMVEDMLADLGAVVVGPAATIEEGLALAKSEALDAALLDVNVREQRIDPVAEALRARSVPLVFATGYSHAGAVTSLGAPVINKPYTQEKLSAALVEALKAPA